MFILKFFRERFHRQIQYRFARPQQTGGIDNARKFVHRIERFFQRRFRFDIRHHAVTVRHNSANVGFVPAFFFQNLLRHRAMLIRIAVIVQIMAKTDHAPFFPILRAEIIGEMQHRRFHLQRMANERLGVRVFQ